MVADVAGFEHFELPIVVPEALLRHFGRLGDGHPEVPERCADFQQRLRRFGGAANDF